MRFRKGRDGEIEQFIADISDMHRLEFQKMAAMQRIPESTVWKMMKEWADREGYWVAFDRYSQPLCMYSYALHGTYPDTVAMWFVACKPFFGPRLAAHMRFVRRHMEKLHARSPHINITTLCWMDHPKAEKWAATMGFDKIMPEGLALRFVKRGDKPGPFGVNSAAQA